MRCRLHVWTAWLAGRSLPACEGRASCLAWRNLPCRLQAQFQTWRAQLGQPSLGLKLQRLRLNLQWLGLNYQRLGLNFEHQALRRPSILSGTHSTLTELLGLTQQAQVAHHASLSSKLPALQGPGVRSSTHLFVALAQGRSNGSMEARDPGSGAVTEQHAWNLRSFLLMDPRTQSPTEVQAAFALPETM